MKMDSSVAERKVFLTAAGVFLWLARNARFCPDG